MKKLIINIKHLLVISVFFAGISFSAYSQTISGDTEPCSNEDISYSFTQVANYCNAQPCTASTGIKYYSSLSNDGWSVSPSVAATIADPSLTTTNIKWNCNGNSSTAILKFTVQCTTYTANTTNGITTCLENITPQNNSKNITIKCPKTMTINGPAYIVCCDVSDKTYSVSNTFGQTSFLWEVSTGSGWEIQSGQGTSSIIVKAGSTGSSQQVKITSGFVGCDDETKAVSILNVDRTPKIEEDDLPSLPWVTKVCKDLDFTFCIKPITTCTTATVYTWSAICGNTKGGANPSITNFIPSNTNCQRVQASQNNLGDNNGYVDITVTATTPCGSKSKTHRVLIPETIHAKPTWTWDGGTGDLCVGTRNVVFEITNQEEGGEYEWIFNNGTTSYTLEGPQVGTYFDEFGPTWAANPNSDVTLTIRAKNACGYSTNTTFIISAARFKSINDQDCDIYLQKRNITKLDKKQLICYPNPAQKLITILKPSFIKQGELKVYNALGDIVLTQIISSDINIITENWQNGIYYIYLTGNNQTLSTVIEINK